MSDPSTQEPSPSLAGADSVVPSQWEPSLSPWMTFLCTLVVGLLIGSMLVSSATPVDHLRHPGESLERLVGREMDVHAALAQLAEPQRTIAWLLLGDEDFVPRAIRWYDELTQQIESPEARVQQAVLLGEAGETARLRALVVSWRAPPGPFGGMSDWVRAGYLRPPPDREAGRELIAEIRAALSPGWFADALVARVAAAIGDEVLQASAQAALLARGDRFLARQLVLVLVELAVLLAAAGIAGRLWFLAGEARFGSAPLPPPWPAADGYGLFIRGVLGFLGLSILMSWVLPPETPFASVTTLLAGLPLLAWTARYLAGRSCSLLDIVGWPPRSERATGVVPVLVLLVGLSTMGEIVIMVAAQVWNLQFHWTDGLLEDLLWGPWWVMAGTMVDSILWAPFVEEVAFRGILYATLRRRLTVWPAVLVSAAAFALGHGYGLLGFASVFWSGLLWALAYERTRSLLPCILAHAANNLLVMLGFVWLFRV